MARGVARRAAVIAIWLVVLLGILDALTTIVGIQRGLFRELNPFLEAALAVHVGWFLLFKGGCTMLWSAVMWRESWRRWVVTVNASVAGAYSLVVIRSLWHLAG